MSFSDLHNVIQILFGWENEHLHKFVAGQLEIGDYAEEDSLPINYSYEGDLSLEVILDNDTEFIYEYDFGDGWRILIKVEERKDTSEFFGVKVLNAVGEMAQENCGGVLGLNVRDDVELDVGVLNELLAKVKAGK